MSWELTCLVNLATDSVMKSVNTMHMNQLHTLIKDSNEIEKLVDKAPQLLSLQRDKQKYSKGIVETAESNLALESRLQSKKEQLLSSYTQMNKFKEYVQDKCSSVEACSPAESSRSLQDYLQLMEAGAREAEEESELVASQFIDSDDVGVEEFLSKFKSVRTLAHSRRIKAEKLAELIKKESVSQTPDEPFDFDKFLAALSVQNKVLASIHHLEMSSSSNTVIPHHSIEVHNETDTDLEQNDNNKAIQDASVFLDQHNITTEQCIDPDTEDTDRTTKLGEWSSAEDGLCLVPENISLKDSVQDVQRLATISTSTEEGENCAIRPPRPPPPSKYKPDRPSVPPRRKHL